MKTTRRVLQNHWVVMAVCCLIPAAALIAIIGFSVPVPTAALIGLVLLCPLSHLLLMRNMDSHNPREHVQEVES